MGNPSGAIVLLWSRRRGILCLFEIEIWRVSGAGRDGGAEGRTGGERRVGTGGGGEIGGEVVVCLLGGMGGGRRQVWIRG